MSSNHTDFAFMIIISTIIIQLPYAVLGQPSLIDKSQINGSQFQTTQSNPLLDLNETQQSFRWSDEAEAPMPIFQDYFILGNETNQNISTFNMIVIGDSIAWGAGLKREEKYYYKVAEWLQQKLKKPIEVRILAHTGASLNKSQNVEISKRSFINPELSSWDPTLLEQADKISNPEDVDLILLSGGINDVGVNKILNPIIAPDEMQYLCDGIEDPMYSLLIKLLGKCPDSYIIVTSYYPIVSNDTSEQALDIFINEFIKGDHNSADAQGFALIKSLFGTRRILSMLSSNSNLFHNQSILSIGRAIDRANQYSISELKGERVIFALVDFPSNRSYGTNESWLWRITDPETNEGRLTNDHMYDYRISFCNKTLCNWSDIITAVGHPNVEGANEYNRTIINALLKILQE